MIDFFSLSSCTNFLRILLCPYYIVAGPDDVLQITFTFFFPPASASRVFTSVSSGRRSFFLRIKVNLLLKTNADEDGRFLSLISQSNIVLLLVGDPMPPL